MLTLDLTVADGRVRPRAGRHGRADPRGRSAIPTTLPRNPAMPDAAVANVDLNLRGRRSSQVTCVSMGNPHCVTFVDELSDAVGPRRWARKSKSTATFPQRVNAEFVQVLSPSEVRMRVWERGSRRDAGLRHRRTAPSAWPAC